MTPEESMTRSILIVLAACAVIAACDESPTAPTTHPLVFTATLSPANEVPAVANAEASGSGAAQIQFDVTRDAANTITGGTVRFYFEIHNFPNDTRAIGAHIHSAPAGVNGPIVVDTGLSAATPVTLANRAAEFRSQAAFS